MNTLTSWQSGLDTNDHRIRPINIRRDLLEVANLIELCFSKTLDQDGRRYIAQMRRAAKNPGVLGVAGASKISVPGFVWEESGVIIGNISLIPVRANNKNAYLIANVAVHPDYRQRGIAKQMTTAALSHIKMLKVQSVWLQVSAKNPVAVHLYQSFGFIELAQRTTWHGQSKNEFKSKKPPGITISPPRKSDWLQQKKWLRQTYPREVIWHLPLNLTLFRPGFAGKLNRLVSDVRTQQWAARQGEELIGILSWQSSSGMADWLWLATSPENEERALLSLLPHVLEYKRRNRLLTINYMAGNAISAFEASGFIQHRTLIWMNLRL